MDIWKIPNKNAILTICTDTTPFLCILAPSGITRLLISSEIPIFLAASRLTGIHAVLLQAPAAVVAGSHISVQYRFTPSEPPLMNGTMMPKPMKNRIQKTAYITDILATDPIIWLPTLPISVAK